MYNQQQQYVTNPSYPSIWRMFSLTEQAQTSLPQTPPGSQTEPLQGSVLLRDFPAVSNIRFPDDIKNTVSSLEITNHFIFNLHQYD